MLTIIHASVNMRHRFVIFLQVRLQLSASVSHADFMPNCITHKTDCREEKSYVGLFYVRCGTVLFPEHLLIIGIVL